jgi:hypothetical protein
VLLQVLLCCYEEDPCSLIVAGCASSKLRQLVQHLQAVSTAEEADAMIECRSIRPVLPNQQKMDQLLQYLHKYGQHIDTLDLTGTRSRDDPEPGYSTFNTFLPQLPYDSMQKLGTLILSNMRLQVLPGSEFQGVLGSAATRLTQLQINSCKVMDGLDDLAEALLGLPNLQHLSITQTFVGGTERRPLPIAAIGTRQQLTHLVLEGDRLQDPEAMRHLQGLSSLQHLEVSGLQVTIRARHLSEMRSLKYLKVRHNSDPNQATRYCSSGSIEPAALAGKTQLQDVLLSHISIADGAAGIAGHLSHLKQHLTQTKTLIVDRLVPSTSLCVAFQASVLLETVSISAKLSSQQVFTIAKQFPNLRALEVNTRCQGRAPCDHTSRLISCCPGLQSLVTPGFSYSAEVVAQLSGLSSLTKLSLHPDSNAWDTVCQMTQLRNLRVSAPAGKQGDKVQLLRQLTQLKQLTRLDFRGGDSSCWLTAVSLQFSSCCGSYSDRLSLARCA